MAFKQLKPAGLPCPAQKTYPTDVDPRQMFWDIIANLKIAKRCFGLKDRHFGLLQALVSFVRERESSGAWIVFASNEKLCQRANEMGERTMRRNIAQLVEVGLLRRSQSPNGKRYVHRARGGEILQAYGFDLGPLLERADEISILAAQAEETAARIKLLRDQLSTLRRQWPIGSQEDDAIRRALRRQLSLEDLEELIVAFSPTQPDPLHSPSDTPAQEAVEAITLTPDAGQNDRHHQRSKQINIESKETSPKKEQDKTILPRTKPMPENTLAFSEVLSACPEAIAFAQSPLRSWNDLHILARFLAPMLGLRREVIDTAEKEMGQGGVTLSVLAITQMHNKIQSPGAYLRRLIEQSSLGKFDPVRLIKSLKKRLDAVAWPEGLPG